MILAICAAFTMALFVYVFYPERHVAAQRVKTRLDLLLARGRVPTAKEIEDLIVVMERLDTETPVVSNRLWKKAKKQIKDRVV